MGEGHAGTGEHTTRIESSGGDALVRDDASGGGVGDDAVQTAGVQTTAEDAQTLFTHTESSLESAAESSKSKPPPPTPVGGPERSTPTTRAQSQSQSSAQIERETPIRLARQLSRQAGDFLQEAGATVTASPAVRRAREGIEKLQRLSRSSRDSREAPESGKVLPTKRGSFLSKDTGTGNLGVGGRAIRVKEPGTELLACTGHVFVFGDLNYRVDPGAVVAGKWGAMWKKTNGAASGSIAAAVAGLAAKSAKKKAVADAFQATSPSSGKGARPTNAEDLGSNPAGSGGPGSSVTNTPVAPRSPRLSVASVGSRGAVSGAVTPGGGGSDADDAFNSQAWVEGWRAVATLVENSDWPALRRGDQLARELRAGLVLHGFREGELGFRPTFKLDTGGGKVGGGKKGGKKEEADPGVKEDSSVVSAVKSYSRKRVPSWCDRVVFTSLPGGGSSSSARVNVVTYGACHGLQTSDHAPVFASLEVACRGVAPPDSPIFDDSYPGPGNDESGANKSPWEGRLRHTPERVKRLGGEGGAGARLVPTAPPAAATVHIRGFRVTAERFQKLDQKLDSKLDSGAKETAPETAPETTTLSTPKPPTRPPETHKEDRDNHASASDAAATSDVDAAAAALRKLAAVLSDRNARSDSSYALPAVTVHVSCEGGVVVTSPEAPGDRSASVADVRAAKPPSEVNTPGPREDVNFIAYDSDDEARAAYGSLEMVWSDDAMPSVTLGPVEADARGVNTGGRTFEGSSDEKNASSNTDSPTKQRGRLGNPVRAAGRLLAGARRASRGDSNRSGRGTPIGTGSEPSSRRVSLDNSSSIDDLKSSDASAHAAALARGIEALTVSSGDDTSTRNTWTRRARVASLGERHAVVTVCVDGVAVGSASVSLFEPCVSLNAGSRIRTRDVSDDTDVLVSDDTDVLVSDDADVLVSDDADVLVRSADCAFVVPLTRCGRLFGRVEGTVSIATPGGLDASSS